VSPLAPLESLDSYRGETQKTPAIIMWFQAWERFRGNSFRVDECNAVLAKGAIPLICWEPWDPADRSKDANYQLDKITRGDHDAYIHEWAQAAKLVNGPVMLRPMHEMNGEWYPWNGTVNGNTAADYIAAWRHIHDIFVAEGATNVTWVWSINCLGVPINNTTNGYEDYYPGDAYVDWTSISGYNWGTSRPPYSLWESYSQIYERTAGPILYLKTINKPILLSEFGSVSSGGDKAAWLTDAYAHIKAEPRIKGVVYYDKREAQGGDQDWQAASNWQSWRAYRRVMADPYFKAGLLGTLPDFALGTTP
jgi:beta-mannanase